MLFLARDVREHHIGYVKTGNQNSKIQTIIEIYKYTSDKYPFYSRHCFSFLYQSRLSYAFCSKMKQAILWQIILLPNDFLLARNLIQQGFPLTTVCYDSGFRNYSTFYRAWKNLFRTSPRQGTKGDIGKPKIVD